MPALGVPFFWTAEVGLAFLALFVGLLCYGVGGLLKAIGAALGTIPLLFGIELPIGKWFVTITGGVANFFIGLGDSLLGFIANILKGIANSIVSVFDWLKSAIVNHATQIEYLHNHGIPNSAVAVRNTANAYTELQLQYVRTELHAAQAKWEHAHSYADAVSYVNLQASAPSVEHAFLAGLGRTLIASENHAQDLHDQLRDYIGRNITGQADVALPYNGQTLTGVAGAIAIPRGIDLGNVDVQDIIKTGSKIAVGTAVAVIAEKIVQCLVSKCAGNNNFDNLLKDALGIFSLAEFAVFLEQFVKDPAGTLTEISGTVAPIAQTGVKTLDDVWGDIAGVLGL